MPDIIQLLPDNIANQIAAGEVIQRPASAVKELLENAVDAGATDIQLIISDAGKGLVQVIDNGRGMSETDARMSFERHATSKIQAIEDLFHIRTMGFRGEALASIAAVAQVEMKTRRAEDELGVCIHIENSVVLKQEPCACAVGTGISMKNVFFNVPARRNFLKTNNVELRHIMDEFIRVALAFPKILFKLINNSQQVFYLEAGSLKQRALQVLGNQYQSKLVSIKEETNYLDIYGFVGKPDTAKKTRGDQYFFVNNRFIRSAYLNHAVTTAFGNMIAKDSYPLYVICIDIDPSVLDINVHPTKQEIKFEDDKIVYAFVQAAVKHALAQFSIAPSIDFTLNADIQQSEAVSKPFTSTKQEEITSGSLYKTFTQKHQAHFIEPGEKSELKHWKDFFTKDTAYKPEIEKETGISLKTDLLPETKNVFEQKILPDTSLMQLHQSFIVAPATSGFLLVHQQLAHERVLYEKFFIAAHGKKMATQQSLFPITLELAAADALLLQELLPDLQTLGYQLEHFGGNTWLVQGTPADIYAGNENNSIELLLEQYKHFASEIKYSRREKLVRCMARQQSIKAGRSLTQKEMLALLQDLFACNTPNVSPAGNPTYIEFTEEYLKRLFEI